jgi:hypothetical protein
VFVDELALLRRRESDHAELVAAVECREDPIVKSEIGVAHVGAFNHSVQGQCHAPEIIWPHLRHWC